jgi:hypothetical protein
MLITKWLRFLSIKSEYVRARLPPASAVLYIIEDHPSIVMTYYYKVYHVLVFQLHKTYLNVSSMFQNFNLLSFKV